MDSWRRRSTTHTRTALAIGLQMHLERCGVGVPGREGAPPARGTEAVSGKSERPTREQDGRHRTGEDGVCGVSGRPSDAAQGNSTHRVGDPHARPSATTGKLARCVHVLLWMFTRSDKRVVVSTCLLRCNPRTENDERRSGRARWTTHSGIGTCEHCVCAKRVEWGPAHLFRRLLRLTSHLVSHW